MSLTSTNIVQFVEFYFLVNRKKEHNKICFSTEFYKRTFHVEFVFLPYRNIHPEGVVQHTIKQDEVCPITHPADY